MSKKSIKAVYDFYHANYKDGDYNVRYNNIDLGAYYVYFGYQSDKWTININNLPDNYEERNFDTEAKGTIIYNKSQNILEINQCFCRNLPKVII